MRYNERLRIQIGGNSFVNGHFNIWNSSSLFCACTMSELGINIKVMEIWISLRLRKSPFLVDNNDPRYFDCNNDPLSYGEQLINDILNRTEMATPQDHCFLATELAFKA